MIDSIKGLLDRKDIASAVILANGVGLKVNMSINALEDLPQLNNEVRLFTYLHVREDILDLYGFINEKERDIFHLLISVNGIGPKLAITILSGIKPNQLQSCIVEADVKRLTKIPGVGSKTAKRMILELKEKFEFSNEGDLEFINPDVSPQLIDDVISSLVALGYKNENAKKICKELQKKGELVGELETIIKKALRH